MEDLGTFDYVIVGAGSAGCVLANRLSADPSVTVALLEAGGSDDYIWVKIPVGYLYCMGNPRTDWCFSTEPEAGLNGRSLAYPRGRILGGCSAINGMIYMRGQARDYDLWRQAGNVGWGWDDVLPYFTRSEDHYAGASDLHGAGGEWRVEEQRLHWDILDRIRDAFEEVGIPKVDDFNRGDNEGTGYFQVNQRSGVRWSTATAFLKPARSRANLKVFTGAIARRIAISEGRATGVELARDGRPARISARGEVVLSAGAIGSPVLLQLSGIGPGAVLRDLGVSVVADRRDVGGNLQDHLQVRTIYRVENALTLNDRTRSLFGKARIALEYALTRSGPMAMAPSQLGAFAKSDPSFETANLEYHVQPLSLDKFGDPLHPFPGVTMSVCNLRPESRGEVRPRSPDPGDKPRIVPNYLTAEADRRVAADSIRLTRRVMAARALAPHRPMELKPGPEIEGDDALARAAGDIGTTIFHPVGTCRMGVDADAVTDPRLRVVGIDGLRVVDAAVMPTITSGNTNAPVIMIAEKAADMIVEDRRAAASRPGRADPRTASAAA